MWTGVAASRSHTLTRLRGKRKNQEKKKKKPRKTSQLTCEAPGDAVRYSRVEHGLYAALSLHCHSMSPAGRASGKGPGSACFTPCHILNPTQPPRGQREDEESPAFMRIPNTTHYGSLHQPMASVSHTCEGLPPHTWDPKDQRGNAKGD